MGVSAHFLPRPRAYEALGDFRKEMPGKPEPSLEHGHSLGIAAVVGLAFIIVIPLVTGGILKTTLGEIKALF